MFDNTKLPLTTWFLAIYLLAHSKNGISAMGLKRQLGVSYNTAWMLKHKLMQTMRERDDSQPLRASSSSMTPSWAGRPAGASGGAVRPARRPWWRRRKSAPTGARSGCG